ncbi:hypothetical protein PRIPAC_83207 [Pristionchus pacificus]|uniref:Cytochrome-b5 reductase n=1 Tax=Pristionchus pacificus TaxID=54126 RepID=A0A2A6CCQ5_PRIPA|nr:hypothetical protein PRIPAC_83207 [Pristionchus pacificus]|eukprot:PDM75823.1 hypothetical protein PRIPAC_40202 [Pristionchus pacificus]
MGAANCKGNKVQSEEKEEEQPQKATKREEGMSLQVPTPGGLTAKAPVGRSEYGRVKVALPRGKGLLDWIQKSNGKNLASARLPKVSAEELVKHNKQDDCWVVLFGQQDDYWVVLFGQVYDVSPYLEYHPGGVPELMRAAGTDATGLFNQYHSWVNYDNMLKACIVGRFDGDTAKLPAPGPSTLDDDDTAAKGQGSTRGAEGEMSALAHSTMDSHNICATSPSPHSVLLACPSHWNVRTLREECVSHCVGETFLRLLVKTMDGRSPLELKWDPLPSSFTPSSSLVVSVDDQARIRLDFSPSAEDAVGLQFVQTRCTVRERPPLSFHEARVVRILRHRSQPSGMMREGGDEEMEGMDEMNLSPPRDSLLLIVETDETASVRVPVGHHVELRVRKGASQVGRPYTPIPLTDAMRRWMGGEEEEMASRLSSGRVLAFLIKVYEDGVVTPAIERLKRDDLVHISDPIGSIDFSVLPYATVPPPSATVSLPINDGKRTVVCLAAGTGLTPMLGVIRERGWERCRLIAYNKTEADTPRGAWMEEGGEDTVADDGRIVHVLSAADDTWTGARGRVSRENIGELMVRLDIIKAGANTAVLKTEEMRGGAEVVFVCGPDGFVQEAARLLQASGHPTDLVHIFQG